METQELEVLVILDITSLQNQEIFEKHIKKEGFIIEENENFVYTAKSSTSTFSTKAYILEVFRKALQKITFEEASMVFLLNETAYPAYYYDKDTRDFEFIKEEK